MDLTRLVTRNILNKPFRSSAVLVSILMVIASASLATVIIQGATDVIIQSASNINSLQADIVVIARAGSAGFMSQDDVDDSALLEEIASTPGVAAVSPQQRLSAGDRLLQGINIEVVAFDPVTDFTILPLLASHNQDTLAYDSVILGSRLSDFRDGETLDLWGYPITVAGHLQSTADAHDRTFFVTFEGAQRLLQRLAQEDQALPIRGPESPPLMLVRVDEGIEAHDVAQRILKTIRGVTVYDHSDFLGLGRERMSSMSSGAPFIIAFLWVAAAVAIVLVCMVLANAHEWEIGVLQALGSPRGLIFRWLSHESLILACGGGLLGLIITLVLIKGFRESITSFSRLPIIAPSPRQLLALSALSMATIVPGALLAGIYPVWRIAHRDASMALTE